MNSVMRVLKSFKKALVYLIYYPEVRFGRVLI